MITTETDGILRDHIRQLEKRIDQLATPCLWSETGETDLYYTGCKDANGMNSLYSLLSYCPDCGHIVEIANTRSDICMHLAELMRFEVAFIKKHLADHKWFQHIPNEVDGVADFNEKYGWLMREIYCAYVCKDKSACKLKNTNLNKKDY